MRTDAECDGHRLQCACCLVLRQSREPLRPEVTLGVNPDTVHQLPSGTYETLAATTRTPSTVLRIASRNERSETTPVSPNAGSATRSRTACRHRSRAVACRSRFGPRPPRWVGVHAGQMTPGVRPAHWDTPENDSPLSPGTFVATDCCVDCWASRRTGRRTPGGGRGAPAEAFRWWSRRHKRFE